MATRGLRDVLVKKRASAWSPSWTTRALGDGLAPPKPITTASGSTHGAKNAGAAPAWPELRASPPKPNRIVKADQPNKEWELGRIREEADDANRQASRKLKWATSIVKDTVSVE